MNDIYNQKLIRIPVKLVNNEWEYFYGGPLSVKDGSIADLVLDESAIDDKVFLSSLKHKSRHKILDKGTELLVALTIKSEPELERKLSRHLIPASSSEIVLGTPYYFKFRSPDTHFVKITIGKPTDRQKEIDPKAEGGIWLELQGLQPKGLTTSSVKLSEDISSERAISLNHAFTMLSESYEPWRKSHTGNIYDRLLYKESNGKWYPIEVLRNTAIMKDEHQLIKDQWEGILKKINLQ